MNSKNPPPGNLTSSPPEPKHACLKASWVKVFIVLFLIFYSIGVFTKQFNPDEWQTMVTAVGVADGLTLYSDIWDNHGPLLTLLLAGFIKASATHDHAVIMFGGRLMMLAFLLGTLWLTGRLARRAWPDIALAAPLAIIVLLCSQTFFSKGFEIRPDAPLLLVWTACLLLLIKSFQTGRTTCFFLTGVVLGACFAFSLKTLLLGLACGIGFLVVQLHRRRFCAGWLTAFGLGVPVAPLAMLAWLKQAGSLNDFFKSYLGQNFDRAANSLLSGLNLLWSAEELLLVMLVAAGLLAFRSWRADKLPEGIAILLAVAVTMLALFLRLPTYHQQSLLFFLPPASVVIAWAIGQWSYVAGKKRLGIPLAALLIVLAILSSKDQSCFKVKSNRALDLAQERQALLPSNALLFDSRSTPLFQPRPFIYKAFVSTLCKRIRQNQLEIDIPAELDRMDVPYAASEDRLFSMGEKVTRFLKENYLPLNSGKLLAAGTVLKPSGEKSEWHVRLAGNYSWRAGDISTQLRVDGKAANSPFLLSDGPHVFTWPGGAPLILSIAPPGQWADFNTVLNWKDSLADLSKEEP